MAKRKVKGFKKGQIIIPGVNTLKDVSTLDKAKVQEFINQFGIEKTKKALSDRGYDVSKFSNRKTTSKTVTETEKLSPREQYKENLIGALGEQFDDITEGGLRQFRETREDSETQIEYYRADFDKITSRKNQDYFTGIALQNKEFSKSLDYVANLGAKTIGALEGFGKSRIVEATKSKIETDARFKLNFDRSMEDLNIGKQRAEARFKLGKTRLAEGEQRFRDTRATDKKVGNIETAGGIDRYYDNLILGKTLSEDEAAKRRRNITGGGTGIENIFNY